MSTFEKNYKRIYPKYLNASVVANAISMEEGVIVLYRNQQGNHVTAAISLIDNENFNNGRYVIIVNNFFLQSALLKATIDPNLSSKENVDEVVWWVDVCEHAARNMAACFIVSKYLLWTAYVNELEVSETIANLYEK